MEGTRDRVISEWSRTRIVPYMHLTGSGKMQEQEGVGPTRTTRNPFDDEEDGRGEHGEAAPRVHTPSSARTPKDDKEEDGAMTKNPFGDDATVDSRFNKDNANVLKKPQNPFLSSSLDALQPAHRPVLPPRPPGPLPSPSTFPRGDTAAAPPLPSRPSVLASKKSTIFHSEPDALSRKPDPQSLLKSDSSPERRTLHHQPSLERFNALRIKDVVLNPETGSAGRKQPLPRIGSFPPIQHRGSIRALSVSHQVVVTCTQNVRIWDVASGENTKTVFLGEAKPSSVAFVPTLGPGSTEPFVWVGLEKGELLEINVLEGRIVARRSLHSSTLLHILRFRETSLVTIDEQGALKIWTDWDSRGFVSLLGRPKGLRVSPRLSVAYLYDDHLWLGAGKHLEVYNLAPDALTVLQKKLELPSSNFGNVTCITSIRQKLSSVLVYTGHDDGKLIEWDPTLFEKKRIFQLGVYRITSLFGLDMTALWVGFLTGKLAIYDLNVEESSLVKEFQAHSGSGVATLTHDQKSAFQLGRSHLLSASETGEIRVWDALLAEDWIGKKNIFF